MTISNEPGYYADGRFGIRIENIVLVRDVQLKNNFGEKGYLGFENVTMWVLAALIRAFQVFTLLCFTKGVPFRSH